jgi:hypothetical protein
MSKHHDPAGALYSSAGRAAQLATKTILLYLAAPGARRLRFIWPRASTKEETT